MSKFIWLLLITIQYKNVENSGPTNRPAAGRSHATQKKDGGDALFRVENAHHVTVLTCSVTLLAGYINALKNNFNTSVIHSRNNTTATC